MIDEFVMISLIAVVSVLVVVIAKLSSFLERFHRNTQYICREMDRAADFNEYCRRRKELRCHYLTLIPFVSEKNVIHVYRFFFNKDNNAKNEERKDSIVPLLMPSILSICICLVCVCGMTWAWYTASVQTSAQKMTAAYYEVTVESVMDESTEVELKDGGYKLESSKTYTITLKAEGTAEKCGGYCLIENQDGTVKYYTQTFKPQNTITINLTPTENGRYTFTGVWGSHPVGITEKDIIKGTDEENILSPSTDVPNTVPAIDDTPSTPVNPVEPSTEKTESEKIPDINETLTEITSSEEISEESTEPVSAFEQTENSTDADIDTETEEHLLNE